MTDEKILEILLRFRPKKMLPDNVQGMRFVCGYLGTNGITNVKELGDALEVSSARMAVILNKLEEKELVKRIKSKDDKRITYVKLTEKGYESINEVRKQMIKRFMIIKDVLGEEEFERFMIDLEKISNIDMEDIEC